MGHAAQRIEVLLIGVLLIISTAIGAGMWWFQAIVPTYDTQVAQPLSTTPIDLHTPVPNSSMPTSLPQIDASGGVDEAHLDSSPFRLPSVFIGQLPLTILVLPWLSATILITALLFVRRKRILSIIRGRE